MKHTPFLIFIFCTITAAGQSAAEVIRRVHKAQAALQSVSYTLQRSDTLVSGKTRKLSGKVVMLPAPSDTIFGFYFRAKSTDINYEAIYDGRQGFVVNHDAKSYELLTKPSSIVHMTGSPGGQLLVADLVRLDTAGAVRLSMKQDIQYYYLQIEYPDLSEYDVIKREKLVTIDKQTMLPAEVRNRQETLGKVQDLDFRIKELRINRELKSFDVAQHDFLEQYRQELPQTNKALFALLHQSAPAFELTSFSGETISSATFAGKVVLLDFWEVWCGPCISSFPKVQRLYETYGARGLEVYGITCETKDLAPAKQTVAKRKISFPNLAGNPVLAKNYRVHAVPLYILLDKKGRITFISEGFSDQLESAIKKEIGE